MQEIKVGETFVYEGKSFIAREGMAEDCIRCALNEVACWDYSCSPAGRKDGKWIYFKEVKNDSNN